MRTVRSAARARNRRRPALAWLLVGVGLALAMLARVASATPHVPTETTLRGDPPIAPAQPALARVAAADREQAGERARRDARTSPRRPSWLGRLDLSLVWRRRLATLELTANAVASAETTPRADELWLLATWSH